MQVRIIFCIALRSHNNVLDWTDRLALQSAFNTVDHLQMRVFSSRSHGLELHRMTLILDLDTDILKM